MPHRDVYIDPRWRVTDPSFVVKSDEYFDQVFNTIVPAIFPNSTPEKTAVIGSSMVLKKSIYLQSMSDMEQNEILELKQRE